MRILFAINLFLTFSFTFYSNNFLWTDSLFYNSFSSQLSLEQIEKLIDKRNSLADLGYLMAAIFYSCKIFIIVSTLYVVKLIFGKVFQATFSDISLAVIKADMIFLIPAIIKVTWFTFYPASSLEEVQYFMPGSVFQLFEGEEIVPWLMYPLQALSIWEVGFWFLLAYQLKEFFDNDFGKSFQNVMLSYGSGFLIWVVFVVFLSLNLS